MVAIDGKDMLKSVLFFSLLPSLYFNSVAATVEFMVVCQMPKPSVDQSTGLSTFSGLSFGGQKSYPKSDKLYQLFSGLELHNVQLTGLKWSFKAMCL